MVFKNGSIQLLGAQQSIMLSGTSDDHTKLEQTVNGIDDARINFLQLCFVAVAA